MIGAIKGDTWSLDYGLHTFGSVQVRVNPKDLGPQSPILRLESPLQSEELSGSAKTPGTNFLALWMTPNPKSSYLPILHNHKIPYKGPLLVPGTLHRLELDDSLVQGQGRRVQGV